MDNIDETGTAIIDMPLFSLRRIWKAFRLWFFLVAVHEQDYPLWLFLVYAYRPYASFKAGKY